VIIVENDNTDTINSEVAELSQNAREEIRSMTIEYMLQKEKLDTIKQK
jgi:hypothetical protein